MKALTIHDIQRIAIVKKTDTIFFTKVHLINQFFYNYAIDCSICKYSLNTYLKINITLK